MSYVLTLRYTPLGRATIQTLTPDTPRRLPALAARHIKAFAARRGVSSFAVDYSIARV